MAKRPIPSPEQLRQLFWYEPETGLIWRKPRPISDFPDERAANIWNARYKGLTAGCISNSGYVLVGITIAGDRHRLWGHRVAWALYHGAWPENCIDHINGDKADNRIANLREATHAENMHNRRRASNGTSRFKGVFRHQGGGWKVELRTKNTSGVGRGSRVYLGYFTDEVEAAKAYNAAAILHHGRFARINKV